MDVSGKINSFLLAGYEIMFFLNDSWNRFAKRFIGMSVWLLNMSHYLKSKKNWNQDFKFSIPCVTKLIGKNHVPAIFHRKYYCLYSFVCKWFKTSVCLSVCLLLALVSVFVSWRKLLQHCLRIEVHFLSSHSVPAICIAFSKKASKESLLFTFVVKCKYLWVSLTSLDPNLLL